MKKWKSFINLISIKAFLSVAAITAAIVWAVFAMQFITTNKSDTDIVGDNSLAAQKEENTSETISKSDMKKTGNIVKRNITENLSYSLPKMLIYEEDNTAVVEIDNTANRKIEGTVWLDSNKNGIMETNESVIQDVVLKLLKENGQAALDIEGNPITTRTDADGKYSFNNLDRENYIIEIEFDTQDGIVDLTQMNTGNDETINSKFNQNSKRTEVIRDFNQTGEQIKNVKYQNAGLVYDISVKDNTEELEIENTANRTITGKVWLDSNKNGIMETNESAIQNVVLKLLKENGQAALDSEGNPITTRTDAEGKYTFNNLDRENYIVEIEFDTQGGVVNLTQMDAGSDKTINSKFNQNSKRTEVITDFSRTDKDIKTVKYQNAGLIYNISFEDNTLDIDIENTPNRTIEGTVWLDSNKNGIMDLGENVIQDVILKLLYADGSAVLDIEGNPITARTDAEGKYIFNGLEKENYIVEIEFDTKDGLVKLTQMNVGSNETINSKFSQSSNRTNLITDFSRTDIEINKVEYQNAGLMYDISFNDNTSEVDIENVANKTITGTVWLDSNKNGILEPDEDLLKDAVIKLLDENGEPILDDSGNQIVAITNAYGEYTITNLNSENYILEIEYDGGEGVNIILTQKGVGTDTRINSKFNPETIRTDVITDFTTSGDEVVFEVKYQNAGIIYDLEEQKDNKVDVEFENDPLTYIEIIKTDSQTGEGLSGAKFGIYTSSERTEEGDLLEANKEVELITGDDGRVKSEGLAPGTYYVQEIEAPDGYIRNNEFYEVIITEAGQVIQVPVENDPIGYIRIKKEDSTLGTPLKGAGFGVYPEDALTEGNELDEEKRLALLMTGDDGYTDTIQLAPGKYYVREEVKPDGYRLNTDIVEVIINRRVLETNPIEVIISDIQLGVESKAAEIYITVRKTVSDELEANQMNIEGLGEVLVYSNSVGRRDTNSVPGNAIEIATNKGAWLAGHNSLKEDAEIGGYPEVGYAPPVWATVENDAYATESIVVIPPLGVPLRDYKKDETMYIVVCSLTILAMIGLFSYKQVLIERTYVKIKKKEDENA